MSKYLPNPSSQAHCHSPPKKTGAYTITPVVRICSACDIKYFDAYSNCGGRENALRLNQIFLESLSIEIPEEDSLISSLRFCPNCSLRLSELESLLAKMENLQMRIQNVKDYMCATVTNTAFQSKFGSDHAASNGGDSANSFLTVVRNQVMQNWVILSRNENRNDDTCKIKNHMEAAGRNIECQFDRISSPLPSHVDTASSLSSSTSSSSSRLKSKLEQMPSPSCTKTIKRSPSPVAVHVSRQLRSRSTKNRPVWSYPRNVKEPNALEIFDKLEEQELQGQEMMEHDQDLDQDMNENRSSSVLQGQGLGDNSNNISCDYNNSSNNSPPPNLAYTSISVIDDAEEVLGSATRTIKLEPTSIDGWGVIESVQSFSNSAATSPDGVLNNEEDSSQIRDGHHDHDTKDTEEAGSTSPEQANLPVEVESGEMSELYYDESDCASGFLYNTTTTIELHEQDEGEDFEEEEEEVEEQTMAGKAKQNPQTPISVNVPNKFSYFQNATTTEIVSPTAMPTLTPQQPQAHSGFTHTTTHRPSILRPAGSRAANRETKEKSLDIQMCTLCYKYVVTGVKHNCEEKSTTTMYQCGYCNAVFHSERVLQEHVRRHIRAIEFPVAGAKSTVQCRLCKKQFPSPSKLALHMKDQHGTDIIKCQLCPTAFKDISEFRAHMISHTNTKAPENKKINTYLKADRSFPCKFCGKIFRLTNDLRRHLLIHTGERPFSCNMCDKAFNRKHHLTTHIEVHRKYLGMPPCSEQKQNNGMQ